jgi:HprK-related kinase B
MDELASVRRTYRPDHALGLMISGVPVALHTNAPRVAERLREYFAPYAAPKIPAGRQAAGNHVIPADAPVVHLVQGEPVVDAARLRDVPRRLREQGVKEAFYDADGFRVVVKRRTGVTIYVAEPDHYVVGDLVRNFNQAVNLVMTVYAKAMLRRGFIMLHASAVVGTLDGVAFASASGFGKSTVALALVERHQHLVTNDRLFVRASPSARGGAAGGDVEMVGVPKKPRVNPGTLLRIPSLSPLVTEEERVRYRAMTPEELWALESKHDVDVDELYGPGTTRLSGLLRAIFLLRWSPLDRGWNVRTLPPGDRAAALEPLLKTAGAYDLRPPSAAEQHVLLRRVADVVAVYDVRGRADVDRLADLVLERALSRSPAG